MILLHGHDLQCCWNKHCHSNTSMLHCLLGCSLACQGKESFPLASLGELVWDVWLGQAWFRLRWWNTMLPRKHFRQHDFHTFRCWFSIDKISLRFQNWIKASHANTIKETNRLACWHAINTHLQIGDFPFLRVFLRLFVYAVLVFLRCWVYGNAWSMWTKNEVLHKQK